MHHVTPLAPVLTRVVTRTKVADKSGRAFTRQAARSAGSWASRIRSKYGGDAETEPLASGRLHGRGRHACEQQQSSLGSPYFEHGPSSRRGEAGVRAHQALVRDWAEGGA